MKVNRLERKDKKKSVTAAGGCVSWESSVALNAKFRFLRLSVAVNVVRSEPLLSIFLRYGDLL